MSRNNIKLNYEVGDSVVFLYDLPGEYEKFLAGERVVITEVAGNEYAIKRTNGKVYYIDKSLVIKEEYWKVITMAILKDFLRNVDNI